MTGKPIGAPCTANGDCASAVCLGIDPTNGVCSANCQLGNYQFGCGIRLTPLDAGPPAGACLLSDPSTVNANGDLGLCAQLCDSANDCLTQHAGFTCNVSPQIRALLHNHGYCWLAPPPADAGTD
jgi:hypothetical protein